MLNEKQYLLTPRLAKVAEYIRYGAVLCDVGTDHAKLPIYLVQKGIVSHVYATDINMGPIESAKKNILEMGCSDKIDCLLTDGLRGTENLCITDISICGMGGELISNILEPCNYIRNKRLNFVFQPMTHAQDLRRFLYNNGFEIYAEDLVEENDKLYNVICAFYTGSNTYYTESELYLGKNFANKKHDVLFKKMYERVLYHLENRQKSNNLSERTASAAVMSEIMEELKL